MINRLEAVYEYGFDLRFRFSWVQNQLILIKGFALFVRIDGLNPIQINWWQTEQNNNQTNKTK